MKSRETEAKLVGVGYFLSPRKSVVARYSILGDRCGIIDGSNVNMILMSQALPR